MLSVGFYIKWDKGSLHSKGNVLGDELIAETMAKYLRRQPGVSGAEVYTPNFLPQEKLDVMIYLNDTPPISEIAKKHILYLQNGYGVGAQELLKELRSHSYDGYVFFSNYLLKLHQADGFNGLFLPFGVDLEVFYPREVDEKLEFEVAYIGNDIKGEERTVKYLYPAVDFNFGLYGNWEIQKSRFKFWKNFKKHHPYKHKFQEISRKKIPQELVPSLYSSTKINLNCTIQACVDWDVITLRTLEVLACKGFLITDSVPVAEELLRDCVVFTTGGADLTEKIKFYLKYDDQRKTIADRGYEFVINNASAEVRTKELLNYIQEVI
ncbi:MAG: glycosyltransferase [Bacteriovoracaceae bacterium]|nr:glycosyltransferase [Bacteriovoracaceae bacterium]